MILELLVLACLATMVVSLTLVRSIPDTVRETVQKELRRLFEGEYDG